MNRRSEILNEIAAERLRQDMTRCPLIIAELDKKGAS